jgi:cytochrome c peroxidase
MRLVSCPLPMLLFATALAAAGVTPRSSAGQSTNLGETPPGFEEVPVPEDNPMTEAKIALGRQLYFDPRLSGDGKRSCYGCHVLENGLTDGLPTAVGAFDKPLTRAAPTMWNVAHHPELYWDGRTQGLEKQVLGAWKGGNMGADPEAIAQKLDAIDGYHDQFQSVFGTGVTVEGVQKAVAAYMRTLICGDTPFDRYQQGDRTAVSEAAVRGWDLFRGKAGCGTCHAGILFTDLQYHNVGVGMDVAEPDVGRAKVTGNEKDTGAFKTPTLRNITRTAPYFHNGQARTLREAVGFMLGGGYDNPHLDRKNLRPVTLTDAELFDLIAFLQSLTCDDGSIERPELP